jgi:hypothetical protein
MNKEILRMKKIFVLIIAIISVFLLSGCRYETDMATVKNLTQEDIFKQKEEKYFVFFYVDGCTGCEETKPYIINYYNLVKDDNSKRQIFGVNLSNPKNKQIYVKYSGTGGQGTDGTFYIDGVTNWDELKIGTTPSMISIYISKDGEKTAKYVAQGKDAIVEALEKQLS